VSPGGHTAPRGVIVLAGPSGAGKSRLAERLGLPVLRTHREVVRRAEQLGCRVLHPERAYEDLVKLVGRDVVH
jgi:hypothetical protein